MEASRTAGLIKDREELLFLLAEAAEFEHTVMCSYLYTMMSMKRSTDEGVTQEELEAIERWRQQIRVVAVEEMLHLSLVNNLLTAFGAGPHFSRPNFPVPAGRFPADLELRLSPLDESTLQHFMFIESPLDIKTPDGTAFRHMQHYHREIRSDLVSPSPTDYPSQGHLYHTIANGIDALAEKLGIDMLFAGHGEAQVDGAQFALPGLFAVTDLASAHRALEEIVIQGEGAPAHSQDSHYARFRLVLEELKEFKARRPDFEPARPTVVNPLLQDPLGTRSDVTVTHPLAKRVVDLGNSIYALMLRTFAQVYAPNPLPKALRTGLAGSAVELMYALTKVGEAATHCPLKPQGSSLRAGLSFETSGSEGPLVQRCAARVLGERATELAAVSRELERLEVFAGVAEALERVARNLCKLHDSFEDQLSLVVRPGAAKSSIPGAKAETAPAAAAQTDPEDLSYARTDAISIHFDTGRCIHSRNCVLNAPKVFLANVQGPWLHPEESTTETLVRVAHECPSGAITYQRLDGGANETTPEVNVLRIRENGPYAIRAAIAIDGQQPMIRATLCRCGKSANKPFCDNSHVKAGFVASGERETIPSDPLPDRAGELAIDPIPNGPLSVTGNLEICGGTGRLIQRVMNARLCRCGGSANKPFCDNTHARIGFRSDQ